ncbi:hypothetical protein OH77DRAFT_1430812 [Trametes cingulata]|nr:hypothetical protein OH77DRAFT_1430812 [Trametes cingulata]
MSYYCPMPYRYGVAKIDPLATVQHLNDEVATEKASKLRTKQYLVYLEQELELPFPDRPWYKFSISPIGTAPRTEEPEHGVTHDMCIAIHPNTAHPRNRPPVHTVPEFPFPNCYHWLAVDVHVRIRAKPDDGVFDATNAVRLPPSERSAMIYYWNDDINRLRGTLRRREMGLPDEPEMAAPFELPERTDDPNGAQGGGPLSHGTCAAEPVERSPTPSAHESDDDRCSYTASDSSSEDTADVLVDMNVFGDPNDLGDDYPLVDFSFDIQALRAEDIPDPFDLLDEHAQLVDIIKEAHERMRSGSAPPAPVEQPEDITVTPPPRARGFRALIKTACRRTGKLFRKVRQTLRLPYFVRWP